MRWATPEVRAQIAQMLHDRVSGADIAATFGRTRRAVYNMISRYPELSGIGAAQRKERAAARAARKAAPKQTGPRARRKPAKLYPTFIPEPHNVTLMELDNTTCRWPVNDPPQGTNGHLFCGHEPEHKSSYCSFHARMSEGAGTESERSAGRALEHAG